MATRPARSRNRGAHRLGGKKQALCGPKPRSDVVTWIHRPIKLEEAVVTDLLGLFWSVVTLEVAPPGRVVQGSKGPPSMSLGRVGLAGPAEQRYWRLAAGPSLVWVTIRPGPNGRRFAPRGGRRPRRDRKGLRLRWPSGEISGLPATHRPNPFSSRAARTLDVRRGPSRPRARFGRLSNEERGIACQTEGPGPSNLSRTSFSASFGPTPRPMRSFAMSWAERFWAGPWRHTNG